jgi:hypothetical protein
VAAPDRLVDQRARHDRPDRGGHGGDGREVNGRWYRGGRRRGAGQAARQQAGAVTGVHRRQHRPAVPAFQFQALGVHGDVDDAVRDREHRQPQRQQDKVAGDGRSDQRRRVDHQPGTQTSPAAEPGDQGATRRKPDQCAALQPEDRHRQCRRGQVQSLLHGGEPGRPGRHHRTGQKEHRGRAHPGGAVGTSNHDRRLPGPAMTIQSDFSSGF